MRQDYRLWFGYLFSLPIGLVSRAQTLRISEMQMLLNKSVLHVIYPTLVNPFSSMLDQHESVSLHLVSSGKLKNQNENFLKNELTKFVKSQLPSQRWNCDISSQYSLALKYLGLHWLLLSKHDMLTETEHVCPSSITVFEQTFCKVL